MPGPRYAIAYTPPPESPLARFGARVLGYDCYQGAEVPVAAVGGLEPTILRLMTVEAGRSGFHAGFMSPFCLGAGTEQDLADAVGRFAKSQSVVAVGPLAVVTDDVRIMLRPVDEPAQLVAFAVLCREAFARWCDEAAQQTGTRREPFRFQMTLAGAAPGVALPSVTKALADAFAPMARDHLELDAISLLREDNRRFRVVERWRLTP
jgi:hypothetical protein